MGDWLLIPCRIRLSLLVKESQKVVSFKDTFRYPGPLMQKVCPCQEVSAKFDFDAPVQSNFYERTTEIVKY